MNRNGLETAGKLARQSSGKMIAAQTSRQQSGIVIANMLERAAARTAKELTVPETEDWLELLEQHPGPAIRWAFMEHAKVSEFFPKPAEILTLIRAWRSVHAADQANEQRRTEQAETEKRLAAGEKLYSFADVLAEFKNLIAAKPDLAPERKTELRKRVEELQKGKRTA